MRNRKRFLSCPATAIGSEVMAEVDRVAGWLTANAGLELEIESRDFGGTAYDKHASQLPDETKAAA